MKSDLVGGQIPYSIYLAEALTVTHTGRFVFSNTAGRSLYAFIHVLEGTLQYRFLDDTPGLTLRAGDSVYIPKGCRYDCTYLPEKTGVEIFQFDIHEGSAQLPPMKPVTLSSDAQGLFRRQTDLYNQFDPFRCAARIYDLLAMVQQAPPAIPKKYRRLLPAVEQMEQNPASCVDVRHYADLCHMSVPGFRRSFKEYLGYSPIDYRNALRLTHAKKLIMSGEYSVEEAAYQSGFTNLSFFYRLFKRKFGIRPGSL